MAIIRFNLATKDITIEGSETFVERNFDTISELVTASLRAGERQGLNPRPRREIPVLTTKVVETEITAIPATKEVRRRRKRHSDTPNPEALQVIKPESPPVRKYILRKAGTDSTKEPMANVSQEGAGKVSIESMKENLGLTEQQVMDILRDAEKQGRVRKAEDGSYVWVS